LFVIKFRRNFRILIFKLYNKLFIIALVNLTIYYLCLIILDTFDKNKNTKESMRNLQKYSTRTWIGFRLAFQWAILHSIRSYQSKDMMVWLGCSLVFMTSFHIFCIKMCYNLLSWYVKISKKLESRLIISVSFHRYG
jgi:hypothetical protein